MGNLSNNYKKNLNKFTFMAAILTRFIIGSISIFFQKAHFDMGNHLLDYLRVFTHPVYILLLYTGRGRIG